MRLHPEVMPATQRAVLTELGARATARGFYLGGGTAVAIHLGHRRSVDLDWFTAEPMPDPMALAGSLRHDGPGFEVTDVARGTLHGTVRGVQVSFLEYRYALLRPAVDWLDYGCRLAALEDLACMKLSAIASRGAKKDFVDLYALGRTFSLGRMLGFYRQKFRTEDLGHVLFSLTYFDDADLEAMPELLGAFDWGEVRRTVEAWVRAYVRRQAPPTGLE